MKKRFMAVLMVCVMAVSSFTACKSSKTNEAKTVKLDPDNLVTIKIWHYYNGTQQATFDKLLEKFNSTVGKEKGIYVEGYGHGSVADLEKAITSSVNEEVGAEDMPDIFSTYADTAYSIQKKGKLADLSEYFTKKEISKYVDSYIKEGYLNNDKRLYLLPVAKSSEIMLLNKTDWEPFAKATHTSLSELKTTEGITAVAKKFRSDDVKTGNILAYTGSTSSAFYFPQSVEGDTTSHAIDYKVLEAPVMKGGKNYKVQQGAGMAVTKSDDEHEYAATVFLKWFSKKEQNLEFVCQSSYMPVLKEANSMKSVDKVVKEKKIKMDSKTYDCLKSMLDNFDKTDFYTTKTFENGYSMRKVLDYNLSDRAAADKEAADKEIKAGASRDSVLKKYTSDKSFEKWYKGFCQAMKNAQNSK